MATRTDAQVEQEEQEESVLSPPVGLYGYVWRTSKRQQLWICLLAVVVALLAMAPLELQRRVINQAIEGQSLRLLAWLGGLYLAVILLQAGLKYALRVYTGRVAEDVIRGCRAHLYATAVAPERRTDEGAVEGKAVSIIGSEIEQVGGFVGEAWSEPLVRGGMVASLLGYMLFVEPLLAAISLAVFAPQLLIVPRIQAVVNRLAGRRIALMRSVGDQVVEAHEGGCAERDAEAFERDLKRVRDNRVRIYLFKHLNKGLVNLLNHLGPLSVMMVGGYMVITGGTTLGVVVAFMSGFDRLADPARQLLAYYQLAAQTRVKYQMIAKWIVEPQR